MKDKATKFNKYALDSSAVFYPYFTTKKAQSMFSVGARLNDNVDSELLCKALNDVLNRFPLYKTRLIMGYGAYLLKENNAPAKVFTLDGKVLKPIDTRATNGYQFRLACAEKQIKLEMFHALTDANGAIKFLSSIIRRYRELQGVQFDEDCGVLSCDSAPRAEEIEDSFKKHYKNIPLSALNLKGMTGKAPHRISGTLLKDGYKLEWGVANTSALLARAKAMGVSLTAYVAGVVAFSMLKSGDVKRPITIMIPVNLRKLFDSETLSNFVTFVRLIVENCEGVTLEDCVKSCSEQLIEKASKQNMQAFISTTVRAQRNIIFRVVPLFLKWIFIRLGRLFLKSRQTIIISNLGNITLPEQMGVDALTMNLNVSKNNVQNLGIVSYDGGLRLTFTSAIKELTMPSAVFETFEQEGVQIVKNDVYPTK